MKDKKFEVQDSALDAIRTPLEYGREPEPQLPYILRLEYENQGLVYYGTNHSRDPRNPQFADIERVFAAWNAQYGSDMAVAVIENSIPPLEESRDGMIEKYGESGLITWLARKVGIACTCPEQLMEQYNVFVLERGYSRDDLLVWIFLNSLFFRTRQQPLSTEAITSIMTTVRYAAGEADGLADEHDFDMRFISKFRIRLQELAPEFVLPAHLWDFSNTRFDRDEIKRLQDPFREETVLNEIGSLTNHARDRYIAAHIANALCSGKSVFAVFGWNHVIAQEPFLKSLPTHQSA